MYLLLSINVSIQYWEILNESILTQKMVCTSRIPGFQRKTFTSPNSLYNIQIVDFFMRFFFSLIRAIAWVFPKYDFGRLSKIFDKLIFIMIFKTIYEKKSMMSTIFQTWSWKVHSINRYWELWQNSIDLEWNEFSCGQIETHTNTANYQIVSS